MAAPKLSVTLFPHQAKSVDFMDTTERVFDTSDCGCVDYKTEFLTPTGWKYIKDYNPDTDLVGQINPTTLQLSFKKPVDYIKKYCRSFLVFAPVRGVKMILSPEHRVLWYPHDGANRLASWKVSSAKEIAANPVGKTFATTFTAPNRAGISLTEAELRLMVAVIADGHFPSPTTNRCTINLKKDRKKARIRQLLDNTNIQYTTYDKTKTGEGYTTFTFIATRREKVFTEYYWNCSPEQLAIIADEVFHWDGSGTIFSTLQKQSADFVQYALSSTGYHTSLASYDRPDKGFIEYAVVRREKPGAFAGPIMPENISEMRSKDGFKYCFTTETSFWLARCEGYIFVTGNTGKTLTQIAAWAKRPIQRMLIIAPKSILQPAWGGDFHKFLPEAKVGIAYAKNRAEIFKTDSDVIVTNTDAVTWIAKNEPKKLLAGFSTLVIDESESFKHHTSQRSKAMAMLAKMFQFRSLLSATPAETVTDLWHQALLLDDGATLGNNFYRFRNTVQCVTSAPGSPYTTWGDKEGAMELVAEQLASMTIRHKLEDVISLPALQEITVEYELAPIARKAYNQMKRISMSMMTNGEIIEANSAAAVSTKLRQIASGAAYQNDEAVLVDIGRYELAVELALQAPHSIIFFQWKHQKTGLVSVLDSLKQPYAVIDGTVSNSERERIVHLYQAGYYRTILIHPKSGAHGLTLTKGTRSIWTSPVYQAGLYDQGNHRVYRNGQTLPTQSITIIAKNTIDEVVLQSQTSKTQMQKSMLQILRGYFYG